MRNGFLTLVVVVSTASVAPAQTWAEKMFVKDNVLHLSHDFGIVEPGTLAHHAFPVKNIYNVPIEIYSIRRS